MRPSNIELDERILRMEAPRHAFPLVAFADIKLNAEERNYTVKGLLPRSGIAVVWGPPKSGKSFWCMDVLLHASLAWEYRGRKVQQANVVYVALEGTPWLKYIRVTARKVAVPLYRQRSTDNPWVWGLK
jgi:hypothetical protein